MGGRGFDFADEISKDRIDVEMLLVCLRMEVAHSHPCLSRALQHHHCRTTPLVLVLTALSRRRLVPQVHEMTLVSRVPPSWSCARSK